MEQTNHAHTWGSSSEDVEHPDLLVFDLDPDSAVSWVGVGKGSSSVSRRASSRSARCKRHRED